MGLAQTWYELTRGFLGDELFGLTSQIRRAAAVIEPSRETDTSVTLSEQKLDKTVTAEEFAITLVDSLHADPAQKDDSFLRFVCEVCAKWTELPPAVGKAVAEWDFLSDDVKDRFEKLARQALFEDVVDD